MTSPVPARTRGATGALVVTAMVATTVGQGFARVTFVVVLPSMLGDVVGSYAHAGLLGTLNLAFYLAGVTLVTGIAGAVPAHLLLRVGLAGTTLGLVLAGTAHSYSTFAVAMALLGLFSSAVWVPLTSVVSGAVGPRRRGAAIGVVVAGFGLSVVISAQLAALVHLVSGDHAWRAVWLIEAALALLVLAVSLVTIRQHGVSAAAPSRRRPATVLRGVPGWAALTATYATYGFGYAIFTTYLVVALRQDAGFGSGHAAADYTVLGLFSIGGGVAVGRMSDVVGRRSALIGSAILEVVCCVLVRSGGEPWTLLGTAAFGLLMPGTGTVVASYVSDHVDARAMGAAFGAVTLVFGVAQVGGPWAGGWLADRTGSFLGSFMLAGVAFAVSGVAAVMLPARRLAAAEHVGSSA